MLNPDAALQTVLHHVEADDCPATITELLTEFGAVFLRRPDAEDDKRPITIDMPPSSWLPLSLMLMRLHDERAARLMVGGEDRPTVGALV